MKKGTPEEIILYRYLRGMVFIIIIMSVFLIIGFWGGFFSHYSYVFQNLEGEFLKNQKDRLKEQVEEEIKRIDYSRMSIENNTRKVLKARVNLAINIANGIYYQNRSKSNAEIQRLIIEALEPMKWRNGSSYIWIVDFSGHAWLTQSQLNRKNLLDFQDASGKYVIREEIKIIRESNEGFLSDSFYDPLENTRTFKEQLAFVKNFGHFNWYFGTAEFLCEREKDLQQEEIDRLNKQFAGFDSLKSGAATEERENFWDEYFFVYKILDLDDRERYAQILANPNQPSSVGQACSYGDRDIDGKDYQKQIAEGIKKAGEVFVEYRFKKPGSNDFAPKLTYCKLYKPWNWIVAKGFYLDNHAKKMLNNRRLFRKLIFKQILFGIVIFLAFLGISLRMLSRYAQKIKTLMGNLRLNDENYNQSLQSKIEALAASEVLLTTTKQEMQILLEKSPIMIWRCDEEGKIITASGKGFELIGVDSGSLIGTSVFTYYQSTPMVAQCIKQALAGISITKTFEMQAMFFEASFTPLLGENNTINGVIGTFTDITKFMVTKKNLEKNEKKFRSLVEQSYDGIALTDEEGCFIEWNKAMEKITGLLRKEVIGHFLPEVQFKLLPREERNEHNLTILRELAGVALKTGSGPYINKLVDSYTELPTGEFFFYLETIFPIATEKGYMLAIIKRDVRELKQTELALKESEQRLKEANDTKDKFFSIIAHDLKNPFTTLISLTGFMLDEYDNISQDEMFKHIKSINDSASVTFQLLENLLAWSWAQTGGLIWQPEHINIAEIAQMTVLLMEKTAEKKSIVLSNEISPEVTAFADKNMIFTVLRNLVSNALKFTRRQGAVTIRAKVEKSLLIVSVADTGVGITQADLLKLFRMDSQHTTCGTQNEQGTGLGLVLCKDFVEKNGGKIWVESELGKGSTFYFTLHRIS